MEDKRDFPPQTSELFIAETNEILLKGSFYAAGLGFISSAAIYVMEYFGVTHQLIFAGHWAAICGTYALFLSYTANGKRVRGFNIYLIFLPLVSLPAAAPHDRRKPGAAALIATRCDLGAARGLNMSLID